MLKTGKIHCFKELYIIVRFIDVISNFIYLLFMILSHFFHNSLKESIHFFHRISCSCWIIAVTDFHSIFLSAWQLFNYWTADLVVIWFQFCKANNIFWSILECDFDFDLACWGMSSRLLLTSVWYWSRTLISFARSSVLYFMVFLLILLKRKLLVKFSFVTSKLQLLS